MTQTIIFYNADIKVKNLEMKRGNEVEIVFNKDVTIVLDIESAKYLFNKLEEELYDEDEHHDKLQEKIYELESEIEELEEKINWYESGGDDDDTYEQKDFLM